MARSGILVLVLALFLVLVTNTESQWQPPEVPEVAPPPLCASQIALVNYACGMLPYTPVLPTPPSPPSLFDNHETQCPQPSIRPRPHPRPRPHHRHRHRHEQSHQLKLPMSPMEENCCKWVQQLDSVCVCGLLSRLPAFLERPQHNFSITVGGSCDATYSCGGGIKI